MDTTARLLNERLIIALDMMTPDEALALATRIAPLGVTLKIGLELFYRGGLALVQAIEALQTRPHGVFTDLKLHDIPNTVAMAAEALAAQGVGFFNVHALGGEAMMQAAAQGACRGATAAGRPAPWVLGVTLLTSLDAATLAHDLHIHTPLPAMATHLAQLAQRAGLSGVVCSAQEAPAIRAACGEAFLLVTPGIRPAFAAQADDQARTGTPAQALRAGSDYLVVGRPVTRAADPAQAVAAILDEMALA